jgi:lipopolysaccharide heptosyltransferase II
MGTPPAAWTDAAAVLAVRLDTMGDVLMTTPSIRALQARAGRRVTLLTSRPGAAIAALVPEIDDVITYDAPWMKASPLAMDGAADRELIEELRARGFDAAVIFTAYSQPSLPAALLCRLADIPLRLAHSRDKPYGLLTDWVPETEPEEGVRHEARRQLDLVAHVGAQTADERLSLAIPEAPRARARELEAREGLDAGADWLVLHPGATAPSRRYPPESFIEAAGRLSEKDGRRILVTGDAGERELAASIAAAVPGATSVAGELDLPALCALIADAPLLIANNTGPVHIAAAVGTPVVDLYALTNPQHQPWKVPSLVLSHDVPCRWCHSSVCLTGHHHCLRLVTPDQVVEAARTLTSGRLGAG